MRVLILGAAGFVGRWLLRECRSRGDELFGTHRPGEELPDEDGVTWQPLELLEQSSIRDVLETARPEGLVHLAGQADVGLANRDPVGTFRVNAEGTLRVMVGIREHAPDVRAVVVTSAEAYGEVSPEDLPVRESQPLRPRSPYGASKAAADLAAAQAATGWGLHVTRMRPFNHVGPGQRRGFVAPDFASQVAAVERGEAEPVIRVGNLSARRDFTDVRDVVRAYRDALESGKVGAAYNLCSGVSTSIEEILRFFVESARVPIEVKTDESRLRTVDVPEFLGDASAAAEDLGWSPGIPLTTSLSEVLEEWRRSGRTVREAAD